MERNLTYNQRVRQERLIRRRREAFRKRMHTIATVLVFCFLFVTIISANAIIARAGEGYEKQYQKQYVSIIVSSGETVWDIAKKQMSTGYETINELVKEIGFINGLDDEYRIQSGTVLVVPYYGEI